VVFRVKARRFKVAHGLPTHARLLERDGLRNLIAEIDGRSSP
jgi:hypothetical protein